MDPSQVKLTTLQKIKPLLIAINQEIPFVLVAVILLSAFMWVYIPSLIPSFITEPILDFIVRRFIIGFACAFVTFLATGFTYMVIEDKFIPLLKKIAIHYERESLKVKKEVLDNVIDDEILKDE